MTIHATRISFAEINDFEDADKTHQLTMGLYRSAELPGEAGERRSGANILWRYEQDAILVTADLPATDVPSDANVWTFEPDYAPGTPVRFSAVVDAVARVRGRAVPATDVAGWFRRRAEPALGDIHVERVGVVPQVRRGARLEQMVLDGTALVGDADALAAIVRQGIGRSKAFGCGMLTITTEG
jgi:CRISPR system Cascade subunit CasE